MHDEFVLQHSALPLRVSALASERLDLTLDDSSLTKRHFAVYFSVAVQQHAQDIVFHQVVVEAGAEVFGQ